MRILVITPDQTVRVHVPNALLFNRLTAFLTRPFVTKNADVLRDLSYRDYYRLMQSLRRGRSALNGRPLVEVREPSGTYVRITL